MKIAMTPTLLALACLFLDQSSGLPSLVAHPKSQSQGGVKPAENAPSVDSKASSIIADSQLEYPTRFPSLSKRHDGEKSRVKEKETNRPWQFSAPRDLQYLQSNGDNSMVGTLEGPGLGKGHKIYDMIHGRL